MTYPPYTYADFMVDLYGPAHVYTPLPEPSPRTRQLWTAMEAGYVW